jgi:hypothetical protein
MDNSTLARNIRRERMTKRRGGIHWLVPTAIGILTTVQLFGWGSFPHQHITDAALSTIPESDEIALRLGSETRRLRDTVEMGDWVNSLIVVQENWHVTTEDFPQRDSEYFGNDYLLFPEAQHTFSHIMPQVHDTYRPFFLRALQALRTEDQANAVRWVGSLFHFVTDSGSPAHAIGLSGPNHSKMENWLDARKLDMQGYQPRLLGETDEQAVTGLIARMDGLLSRNGEIAKRMISYADANDRAHMEPMEMDCAGETARVAADVLHTLLVLSAKQPSSGLASSLVATISAPPLGEHSLLPAKLILLGTSYSTLSTQNYASSDRYSGIFELRNLPPGTYKAAIERPGAATLFTSPFTLAPGKQAKLIWRLQPPAEPGNLVQNPDFALHWVNPPAPDHWHHEDKCQCWLSDNIPVATDARYRAALILPPSSKRSVTLEWMAQHWKTTDDPAIPVADSVEVTAPKKAIYARFALSGNEPPSQDLQRLVLTALP